MSSALRPWPCLRSSASARPAARTLAATSMRRALELLISGAPRLFGVRVGRDVFKLRVHYRCGGSVQQVRRRFLAGPTVEVDNAWLGALNMAVLDLDIAFNLVGGPRRLGF